MLTISALEFTNSCNLRCTYCPVGQAKKQYGDGVDYPKGNLTLKNFLTALKHAEPYPAIGYDTLTRLGCHGEVTMHPDYLEYIKIGIQYRVAMYMHTNGVLINSDKICEDIAASGMIGAQFSIHSKMSLLNFMRMVDINDGRINIRAEANTNNISDLKKWFAECQPQKQHLDKMRICTAHNWAMDQPKGQEAALEYQAKCHYIRGDFCLMKWDGTLVSCCFDFEAVNKIGHVDNIKTLSHRKDYKLCETCSPAWVNSNNDMYWSYPQFLELLK
jgi:hypothetical protein